MTIRRLFLWVGTAHLILISWMFLSEFLYFQTTPKSIAVRTVRPMAAPTPISTPTQAPPPKKQTTPIHKKSSPQKKLKQEPSVEKPKIKSTPAPSMKPPLHKQNEEIHLPALIPIASPANPPSVEEELIADILPEISYGEQLTLFLERALILPEQGDVKAELCLQANGELRSYRILSSKSKKNEEFLKKKLPELFYPCFNEPSSITLTVVFRNADLASSSFSPAARR